MAFGSAPVRFTIKYLSKKILKSLDPDFTPEISNKSLKK
jgi:hypothetical protein